MRRNLSRIFSLLLICSAALSGQDATLLSVDKRPTETGNQYIFEFNKEIEYSTTFSENPPSILIYFHNARLAAPENNLIKEAWVKDIVLEDWMKSPSVVKASIIIAEKKDYKVNRLGKLITLQTFPKSEPELQHSQSKKKREAERTALLRKAGGGARITADFRDADIGNVLRLFARQNNINIVASDSVKGKITVTLHQVSLEQALESILRANGYSYVVLNGVVLVKPESEINQEAMITRVFHLKHLDANNVQNTVAELASEHGKVKVLTTSFHNRKDVYDVNERVLPEREVRYWLRSSVLVVRDYPAQIEMMENLIKTVDVPVAQVVIEAKLLEITPTENSNFGIDWSKALSVDLYDEIATGATGTRRYSGRTHLPNTDGRITFGTLTTSEFSAVLNFLNSNTRTKLISNPRILAMDNEPSDISVGTNFPIPQINRGVGGQGDIVTFTYRDVNIQLRVTPHITESEYITMYVNPIIEEITGQVSVDQNTAPITSRREVDTVVKVKNGETIVIGGMIKEQEVTRVDKVWLLGSVPLLGHFFQNKSSEKEQADLMIFITPKILVQ